MARGEMLPIQHAARALGVPDGELRRLAKQEGIPGAVDRDGEWLIPTMSLVSIAKQQGWTLDLAALQHQLDEQSLSRYSGDALAAQAAVLLAKTQATAARVESRDLLRRLREASTAADADRAARLETAESLARLEQELEETRRNHAVADAQLAELRARMTNETQQFDFMVERINDLERERYRLDQCLGWFGRLRYRRLVERDLSRPSPDVEPPPDPGPPNVEFRTLVDRPPPPINLPPAPTSLPPVPITGASTVTDAYTPVGMSVTRTSDGRFDRSPDEVETQAAVPTR